MIDDLLAIAEELSRRGSGRPRRASLNRAVSTAYYALFHALAELCAKEFVGNYQPWEPFRLLYRSLDHRDARKVFERGAHASAPVRAVGRTFVQLQSERNKADYDPGYATSRANARELIERAREAVSTLRALDAVERKLLAALLIAKAR